MRYRLRTLLIGLTMLCVVLARVAYIRRMATFHRSETTKLVERLSRQTQQTPEWIISFVQLHAKWDAEFEVNPWSNPFDLERDSDPCVEEWTQAVYHEAMAKAYECALIRPVPRITLVGINSPKAIAARSRYK